VKKWWGLVLCACACGPQYLGEPDLRFEFTLSAALKDTISALQISLVSNGTSLDCTVVEQSCLNQQVTADRFIHVQDSNGADHKALVFPLSLTAGNPSFQNVSVQGIPVGKDYALVIEALSKESPPRLAGSSCNYIQEITPGTNPTKIAATIAPPTVPIGCDPRVEK
jgi:hypothetical protein